MLRNFPLFLPLPATLGIPLPAPSSPASRTPPAPFSPGLPPPWPPPHYKRTWSVLTLDVELKRWVWAAKPAHAWKLLPCAKCMKETAEGKKAAACEFSFHHLRQLYKGQAIVTRSFIDYSLSLLLVGCLVGCLLLVIRPQSTAVTRNKIAWRFVQSRSLFWINKIDLCDEFRQHYSQIWLLCVLCLCANRQHSWNL